VVLIYAFSNRWGTNISRRTLLALEQRLSPSLPARRTGGSKEGIGVDFIPIYSHPASFFRSHIQNKCLPCQGEVPAGQRGLTLIIGLGDGSKFISKIKIETQAKNSYLDQPIYPYSPILLDLSLPNIDNYESDNFIIGANMGTYNCNWIAYRTQLYLNQSASRQATHHLFLHLPQKANASTLATQITQLLQDNHLI